MKKIGEDGTLSRESRENFHTDGNRINFNSLGGVEKQMNSEMRDLSHQRSEKSKIKYYLLGIDSTPNIFSYSTDRFYSNLKSGYENAVLAALTLWNNLKVRENEDFPFEKSTWIYKFYCSVFPYVILMSFIILFVVCIFVSEYIFIFQNNQEKAIFIGLWPPTILGLLNFINSKRN